ncbi:MAG TPA: hypothetical protein PKD85_17860 [Saprospiraceae bacterium]|nr:hypothetical protein [Saprospiraceae bacterium]
MPTIFFLIAIFTNNVQKGNVFIWLGTLSVVFYEILQPLLGNPIDIWDIIATLLTGFISFKLFNTLFKDSQ